MVSHAANVLRARARRESISKYALHRLARNSICHPFYGVEQKAYRRRKSSVRAELK